MAVYEVLTPAGGHVAAIEADQIHLDNHGPSIVFTKGGQAVVAIAMYQPGMVVKLSDNKK
jgi:hypothetical protein